MTAGRHTSFAGATTATKTIFFPGSDAAVEPYQAVG